MQALTLNYREAHELTVEFRFLGEVNSIHELTALENQKQSATKEVVVEASKVADGRPFTISFGQWHHVVTRSYPSQTRFTRIVKVYIHDEGTALENVR